MDRRADAVIDRAPRAKWTMTRFIAKIRAAGVILLAIPYLLLFAIASVWLWQHGGLFWWGGTALACTAAGLVIAPWIVALKPAAAGEAGSILDAARVPTPGKWSSAWPRRSTVKKCPWSGRTDFLALVRRVVDVVARHYHPDAKDPWLETPFPHALRIVELVARDLRQATLGYVPGSHILTIGDLQRLQNSPASPTAPISGIASDRS